MEPIIQDIKGVFDQLNPYNTGNLILYFSWLVVFVFTVIGIWFSKKRWVRICCYLVNQVFGIGIILSITLIGIITYKYWMYAAGTVVATLLISLWIFKDRSAEENEALKTKPQTPPSPDADSLGKGQFGKRQLPPTA